MYKIKFAFGLIQYHHRRLHKLLRHAMIIFAKTIVYFVATMYSGERNLRQHQYLFFAKTLCVIKC